VAMMGEDVRVVQRQQPMTNWQRRWSRVRDSKSCVEAVALAETAGVEIVVIAAAVKENFVQRWRGGAIMCVLHAQGHRSW